MTGFFVSRASAGLVAAIVLAGCAGGSLPAPQNGSPLGAQQRASAGARGRLPSISLPANLLRNRAARRLGATRRSSSSPSTQWVLYCARANNDCNVLSPLGTLTSTLNASSGLSEPQGNATGLITGYWYIANTGGSDVPYYKTNGSGSPFAVAGTVALPNPVPDPNQYPGDVAVDETGDSFGLLTDTKLAVSNISTTSSGPGSLTVFTTSGSSYSTSSLGDKQAIEGVGVAFDLRGDCFWSFNQAASEGPGLIDEFKSCKGKPRRLKSIKTGFAGGLAFDNNGDLWYTDQLAGTIYECTQPTKPDPDCSQVFTGTTFGDPAGINFDADSANLYVADATGSIDQCPVGQSECTTFYLTPQSDPPIAPSIDDVPAASDADPSPQPTNTPLTPQNYWSAYNLGASGPQGGAGRLVALVELEANPAVVNDMNVYRTKFGLGAVPAFNVYDQDGAAAKAGRMQLGFHSSGTTQMVAANCPMCSIALVEANSSAWADIYKAFTTAKTLDPWAISNSYGGPENGWYLKLKIKNLGGGRVNRQLIRLPLKDLSYKTTIPVTVSNGNSGYDECNGTLVVCFPASSEDVIAVGGTVLTAAQGTLRGWNEVVASFATSGCSAIFPRPAWQPQAKFPECGDNRTVGDIAYSAADVSVIENAVAATVSGTSYAAPSIAALYAAAGGSPTNASPIYRKGVNPTTNLPTFSISSGTNGMCGTPNTYLCDASQSLSFGLNGLDLYNGPTGWGTPNRLGLFTL